MKDETKFLYLFWFCVFVFTLSFTAMMMLLFFEIPERNREMASNTQGFLQGSLMMSAVGFLLTGSIVNNTKKPKDAGATTAEITASITTNPDEQDNNN